MEITEIFQEYYFTKISSSFNPYIIAALAMGFKVRLVKDRDHYSYMYIEIIFEDRGTALTSMRSTGVELTYNLMRQ